MDLTSYNAEDLSSLRPDDYFFEPASRKIYQFRSKEGKAIIVREVGTDHIKKLFKNTLKTVLKVEGDFDKYQVINISDTSATLFNTNIGETFDVGFGDALDTVKDMTDSFNNGDEVVAEIFDYDDIKVIIKLSVASSTQAQETSAEATNKVSEAELKRIKEIEERKAKKRPFSSTESAKVPSKAPQKVSKQPALTKTPTKTTKKSSKKPAAKKETKESVTQPKKVKKEEKLKPEKPKEETKEEKKAREKREKEEKKAREKKEKEEKKAREKLEKEQKKGKKGKK